MSVDDRDCSHIEQLVRREVALESSAPETLMSDVRSAQIPVDPAIQAPSVERPVGTTASERLDINLNDVEDSSSSDPEKSVLALLPPRRHPDNVAFKKTRQRNRLVKTHFVLLKNPYRGTGEDDTVRNLDDKRKASWCCCERCLEIWEADSEAPLPAPIRTDYTKKLMLHLFRCKHHTGLQSQKDASIWLKERGRRRGMRALLPPEELTPAPKKRKVGGLASGDGSAVPAEMTMGENIYQTFHPPPQILLDGPVAAKGRMVQLPGCRMELHPHPALVEEHAEFEKVAANADSALERLDDARLCVFTFAHDIKSDTVVKALSENKAVLFPKTLDGRPLEEVLRPEQLGVGKHCSYDFPTSLASEPSQIERLDLVELRHRLVASVQREATDPAPSTVDIVSDAQLRMNERAMYNLSPSVDLRWSWCSASTASDPIPFPFGTDWVAVTGSGRYTAPHVRATGLNSVITLEGEASSIEIFWTPEPSTFLQGARRSDVSVCRWYHLHLTPESVLILPASWVRASFSPRYAVVRGRDFLAWPTMVQTVISLVSDARFGSPDRRSAHDRALIELAGHALLDLERDSALAREELFKQMSSQPQDRVERLKGIRPDDILAALFIVLHQHKLVPAQMDDSRPSMEACGLRSTPIIGLNAFDVVDEKLADTISLPLSNLMLDEAQTLSTLGDLVPPKATAEALALREIMAYATKVETKAYSSHIEASPPSRLGLAMRPGEPHVSKSPEHRLASIRLALDWVSYLQAYHLLDHRVAPCDSLIGLWQHFRFT